MSSPPPTAARAASPTAATATAATRPAPQPPGGPRLSAATLLRMTRPGFLLMTAAACALGFACALHAGAPLRPAPALAALLLALLAHAAANVFNDYHDALNGADAANHDALHPFTGGARLIQDGAATTTQTLALASVLALLAIAGGLALVSTVGTHLLWIGLGGALLGWAYSAPPLKLMARGGGELAVGLAWWLVVIGADLVLRGQLAWLPVLAGASFALLVACVLLINGFPDARADAAVGKRTLAVRLGGRRAAGVYAALVALAYGGLLGACAVGALPPAAAWGALTLPLSVSAALNLWRHADEPAKLRPAIVATILAAEAHALVLAAALLLSRH